MALGKGGAANRANVLVVQPMTHGLFGELDVKGYLPAYLVTVSRRGGGVRPKV